MQRVVMALKQARSDFAAHLVSSIPHAGMANAKLDSVRGLLRVNSAKLQGELQSALAQGQELSQTSIHKELHALQQPTSIQQDSLSHDSPAA